MRILANIGEYELANIGEYWRIFACLRIRIFAANTSDIRGDIRRPRKPTIRREYANTRIFAAPLIEINQYGTFF